MRKAIITWETAWRCGAFEEAMACYRQALRLRPDYPEAHFNLANVLAGEGKFAEAVPSFREAVRCRPDYVNAHHNLGAALSELGEWAEAANCFQNAIRLHPEHLGAYFSLGKALIGQRQWAEATAVLQKVLSLKQAAPDVDGNKGTFLAEVHNLLGVAYSEQDQLIDAVRHYELAVRAEVTTRRPCRISAMRSARRTIWKRQYPA